MALTVWKVSFQFIKVPIYFNAFLQHLLADVFRTKSNIYDGAFLDGF